MFLKISSIITILLLAFLIDGNSMNECIEAGNTLEVCANAFNLN